MPTCSRCAESLPGSHFYLRPDGRHQGYCKPCRSEYNREWYRQNRDRHRSAVRANDEKYYTRNRKAVDEFKRGRPCADCGGCFPPHVMDFDHVRGDKVDNVSSLVGQRASLKAIFREIAKCDLVCSNCHRLRTHARATDGGG